MANEVQVSAYINISGYVRLYMSKEHAERLVKATENGPIDDAEIDWLEALNQCHTCEVGEAEIVKKPLQSTIKRKRKESPRAR